ncbi:hypothetical protein ABEB36_013010 [Hypothenemus hampei]|uniref:Uncharacterized protein n=1 Tax=Hypothenemus hampei TaxID=57062 RepID=A0ABD1E6J3_HYPHA
MWKKKTKEEKEKQSSNAGSASSFHESTVVEKLNNGVQVTTTTKLSTNYSQSSNYKESRTISISPSAAKGLEGFSSPFSSTSLSTTLQPSLLGSRNIQFDAGPFQPGSTYRSSFHGNSGGVSRTQVPSAPRNSLQQTRPWTYQSPYFNRSPNTAWPNVAASSISLPSALGNTTGNSTGTTLTSVSKHIVPTYSHDKIKLGKVLIINNVKFMDKKEERHGAKKDSQDLKLLLEKIGFDVEHKIDLKGKDMIKKVKEFSQSNFSSYNMSMVILMSHGGNVNGGSTQIVGIDDVAISTDSFVELFTMKKCHISLNQKPKIFMFQCCRGNNDLCHDAVPICARTKEYSDILIAFSTLPGFVSNRNPATGTWYIQSFCKVVGTHYKDLHLEEMLKIVDSDLSKQHPTYTQTSTYESRGFKRCYLYKNP